MYMTEKHSVAQYKGGRVWHGIVVFKVSFLFLFFLNLAIDGTAAPPVCHHKLVSLSKLFSCLRRLCRFSLPPELLQGKKYTFLWMLT